MTWKFSYYILSEKELLLEEEQNIEEQLKNRFLWIKSTCIITSFSYITVLYGST